MLTEEKTSWSAFKVCWPTFRQAREILREYLLVCRCHVWRSKSTAYHLRNIPKVTFGGDKILLLAFSAYGTYTLYLIKGSMNGKCTEVFLIIICCHRPGWWRWNKGGFSANQWSQTQPRKLSTGFWDRKWSCQSHQAKQLIWTQLKIYGEN